MKLKFYIQLDLRKIPNQIFFQASIYSNSET